MAFYNIFESNHSSDDYSYSSIDESTITMPLYNNRYSNISDMYEVACQLEIDGNDLIHEMEMNILMNEHNYFVEHGRAVQYSDGYGYLTEEGNSVWRFIQKAWETLMKYLDQCVSWVIDKCKEWILYFRQAWAKWGMKDGLKGILKKIEENWSKIDAKKSTSGTTCSFSIKMDEISAKTIGYTMALSEFIGGQGGKLKDLFDDIKTANDDTKWGTGKSGATIAGQTFKTDQQDDAKAAAKAAYDQFSAAFKVVMDISKYMKEVKDMAFNGDSASDIKSHYKDKFEGLEAEHEDTFKSQKLSDWNASIKSDGSDWKSGQETFNFNAHAKPLMIGIQNIGLVAYNILQKDLSESLGKVFEKIREGKKEIRQDRIDNRADDGDKEKFNQLKVVIKGYNMLASFAMKLFSRGISACTKIVNVCTKCLKKVNEDLKSEADKLK